MMMMTLGILKLKLVEDMNDLVTWLTCWFDFVFV